MKTRSIARGIVGSVAALLGVMAAGCSADVAPGDEAQIGSTSEALSVAGGADLTTATNPDGTALGFTPAGLEGAASCVIHGYILTDPNQPDGVNNRTARDFMLIAGGRDSGGVTYTRKSYLYDPIANAWYYQGEYSATSGDATAYAKMLQIPGHTDQCLYAGGLNGATGNVSATKTFRATVNGPKSISWAADTAMPNAHARFAMLPCDTSKIVAIGGGNLTGGESGKVDVFTYNATPGSSTWSNLATLSAPRRDLAVSQSDSTFLNFVVASGLEAGGVQSAKLDLLKFGSSCTSVTYVDVPTTGGSAKKLAEARAGAVALPTSSTVVKVVAGDKSAALATHDEEITVSWSGTPSVSSVANAASDAPTRIAYPAFATDGSNFFLAGGINHAGTTQTAVQKLVSGSWSSTTLSTARVDNPAEFLNSTVVTVAGKSFLTSTEVITP